MAVSKIPKLTDTCHVLSYKTNITTGSTYGEIAFYPAIPSNSTIVGGCVMVKNDGLVATLNQMNKTSFQFILRSVVDGHAEKGFNVDCYVTAVYKMDT